jgi:hypothetical protein
MNDNTPLVDQALPAILGMSIFVAANCGGWWLITVLLFSGCTPTTSCATLCEARCAGTDPRPPIVSTALCGCACEEE